MAKIIKVGSQNITPNKIANPFRTSRNSTTNPFKYNNFEGNTLPFELAADVFEGFKPQSTNKLRMIASSVTGSMTRVKKGFEPIVNFVRRIGSGISQAREIASQAWTYAKETPISQVYGIRHMNEAMSNMGSRISGVISDKISDIHSMRENISSKMGYFGKDINEVGQDIIGFGRDIRSQWDSIIAKIPAKTRYTASTPVPELESAWLDIIALEGGIA